MDLNYNSKKLIGNVIERHKQLERKGWDWRSFYNGWIEGRADMLRELREGNTADLKNSKCNKHIVSISTLFDDKGMCLNDKEKYFDDKGGLIEWLLIMNNYKNYPADSDIVKMHFAEDYAGETHGNYTASTLFFRAY